MGKKKALDDFDKIQKGQYKTFDPLTFGTKDYQDIPQTSYNKFVELEKQLKEQQKKKEIETKTNALLQGFKQEGVITGDTTTDFKALSTIKNAYEGQKGYLANKDELKVPQLNNEQSYKKNDLMSYMQKTKEINEAKDDDTTYQALNNIFGKVQTAQRKETISKYINTEAFDELKEKKDANIWDVLAASGKTAGATIGELAGTSVKATGEVVSSMWDKFQRAESLKERTPLIVGSVMTGDFDSVNGAIEMAEWDVEKNSLKRLTGIDLDKIVEDFEDKTGINKYSVTGDATDDIAKNIIESIEYGLMGNYSEPLSMSAMYAVSSESAYKEARESGASATDALLYSNLAGSASVISENLFAGFGEYFKGRGFGGDSITDFDKKLAVSVSKALTDSPTAKNFIQYLVVSGFEGVEEVLEGIMDAFAQKITYKKDEDLLKLINDQDLLDQFVVGTISAGITQTSHLGKSISNKTEFVTGNTFDVKEKVNKSVADYESTTQNKLSEQNVQLIEEITENFKEELGSIPSTTAILDEFNNIKTQKIDLFVEDSLKLFPNMDDAHKIEYNNLIKDVSQVIYETNADVIFDTTQNNVVSIENGRIVVNPLKTDMPIKNIITHNIAQDLVDIDSKLYKDIKSKEEYKQYKKELIATQEFDKYNADYEIVAQEVENIIKNEDELKELKKNDKETFDLINNSFNTLDNKLNKGTKDTKFVNQTASILDRVSNFVEKTIDNTTSNKKSIKTAEKGKQKGKKTHKNVSEYLSTSKLPSNTKPGTYIKPTKPINTTTKEGKKFEKQLKGLRKVLGEEYTAFVDKIHIIAQIAEASGNNELLYKYNNRLMSSGLGQYQIETAQTDNLGRAIGKSINDIWKPIEKANLTTEFDDYLAHRLNEERYEKTPVWDESVTPEMSREIIDAYEEQYPQFVEWAEDVYKFFDNQLQKMIDAGLSKAEARDWLYDNYVTISRNGVKTNPLVQYDKGVKVNSPIRKAKGGNQEIRPMKESMKSQTMLTERAIADNIAGQELLNVLGGTVGTSKGYLTQTLEGENNALIQNSDGTYNYTVYKNGVPVTMQVSKEVADAIRPSKIGEWENLLPVKAVRGISKLQRELLTNKNPYFILKNFFKDLGDAPLNSKFSGIEFYGNYFADALPKMFSNSKAWQQYEAKGGKESTYFQNYDGANSKSKNRFVATIQNLNELVEQAPRFNEYLLTLKHGGTIQEALYNSAEVTTNFARGGDITKALNRNGFNFLNASVQGFDKQIRNFTKQKGAKAYVRLLAKAVIYGIAPAMLNHILLDDDDDYEELPDYIKDNYYLFKTGDNQFIRIPKGRVMAIFGTAARHTFEVGRGNETIGSAINDTNEQFLNNVAPNNPIENNILAPIISVANNKSWNGSKIVPTRLESLPEDMQYDEKTSSIAKWLGKTFNYSPKKIDYLLDQYTGAIGDVVLPMTTPYAESDIENPLLKGLVSPLKSSFTVDSIISNKYVSEFYDKKEELESEMKRYNSIDESDEAFEKSLQLKYLDTVNQEIAELYADKRELENSDLSDKEKYNQARDIQREINDKVKFALEDYTTGYYTGNYATVGNEEYYIKKSNGKLTWYKVDAKTKDKQEKYSDEYDISPEGYFEMKPLAQSYASNDNYEEYYNEIKNIRDNTTKDKQEVIKYVNSLDLSIPQKAMMIRLQGYTSFNGYNKQIFSYVNDLDVSYDQKVEILLALGFDYNKKTKQFSVKKRKKSK